MIRNIKNDNNPILFFTGILLCFGFYCFIIYMLCDCKECTAKRNSSKDDLCEQLNALESTVKLREVDWFLIFTLLDHKLTLSKKETYLPKQFFYLFIYSHSLKSIK